MDCHGTFGGTWGIWTLAVNLTEFKFQSMGQVDVLAVQASVFEAKSLVSNTLRDMFSSKEL